jgi:hypothetical protein
MHFAKFLLDRHSTFSLFPFKKHAWRCSSPLQVYQSGRYCFVQRGKNMLACWLHGLSKTRDEKIRGLVQRRALLSAHDVKNEGRPWKSPSLFTTRLMTALPSARLTLHSTKLCTKFKNFGKKNYFLVLRLPLEAFLSSSQNLKVTRLQGCIKTKLWTCWRNFDLLRSFERLWGSFMALLAPVDGLAKNVDRMCSL